MNGRYLIVFVLLGGVLYGLTTAVGDMLAEKETMSAYPVAVEWSSVPNVGSSARGGSPSVSVPVSSRTGSSLFHHPAAYSAPAPQGYAAAPSGGSFSWGGYAAPSAYPASQGLYLTSSATLQSYGGGMENGGTSFGNHSAATSVSPASSGVTSAVSLSPVAAPLSSAVSSSYALAAPAAATGYASSAAMPYTTQQSAPRRNGPRRAPGTIGSTLDNWIQGLDHSGSYWYGEEDGIWYFYENELRNLYESSIANGDLPVGTTWEQFLKWFEQQSSKYQFYNAPLSDGVGLLIGFALLYAIVLFRQHKAKVC